MRPRNCGDIIDKLPADDSVKGESVKLKVLGATISVAALLLVAAGCGGESEQGGGAEQGGEGSTTMKQGESAGGARVAQAPALPGAQGISSKDRVYTADQSSNTVSVIDPSADGGKGKVLGTIALGQSRLAQTLGPVDKTQVNVHGLGFSRDGRFLDAIDVTSNAAQVIDTTDNEVKQTAYVGRSPHEGFISPDGKELWVAVRGENYVSVVNMDSGEVTDRIKTAPGASKVVFSPDGKLAYVNHFFANELDVIEVDTKKVTERVEIPKEAGISADEAISPDGEELWLGHPMTGRTTIVDAKNFEVETVIESGPRTNHPNFASRDGKEFAYVTVGGMDQTLVYERSEDDGAPRKVAEIENSGAGPHGIWPSPDNSRIYVALQKSDAVDVIDTETNEVVNTLRIGQDPQALVYVADAVPSGGGTSNLTEQGLGKRIENIEVDVSRVGGDGAKALASVREVSELEEIDIAASRLPPNKAFTVYASDGKDADAITDVKSDEMGGVPEALAFAKFFDNGYDEVILVPKGQQP